MLLVVWACPVRSLASETGKADPSLYNSTGGNGGKYQGNTQVKGQTSLMLSNSCLDFGKLCECTYFLKSRRWWVSLVSPYGRCAQARLMGSSLLMDIWVAFGMAEFKWTRQELSRESVTPHMLPQFFVSVWIRRRLTELLKCHHLIMLDCSWYTRFNDIWCIIFCEFYAGRERWRAVNITRVLITQW